MCSDLQPAKTDPRHAPYHRRDETFIRAGTTDDLPAESRDAGTSYYGLPPVKHSHYRWKTALSFLSEALGGAPQVIATAIHFSGNGDARTLVRAGRYLALASSFSSPALLISELHTPRRWFNMLRIFRPTSSMSIGNMSLTAFGLFSFLTAAGQLLEDLGHTSSGRALSGMFSIPAAAAGGMICLYPGTELEKTCTPLWAGSSPMLSPLFAATGLSAGAAALDIAAERLAVPDRQRDLLTRFSLLAHGIQLAAAFLVENKWRSSQAFRSFKGSRHALMFRLGVIGPGILFPLVVRLIQVLPGMRLPAGGPAASAAAIAGGFMLYNLVLEAGNASADNSTEYLEHTGRPQTPQEGATSSRTRFNRGAIGFALFAAAGMAYLVWRRRARQ